ncbi:hypothetical protein EJ110_NYTH39538 [Nymphaea thermarum]|nr:hypothetical protein EJ110_NYTH39538 [Nymphaea thermarum]
MNVLVVKAVINHWCSHSIEHLRWLPRTLQQFEHYNLGVHRACQVDHEQYDLMLDAFWVLADQGLQVDQMVILTSYWGVHAKNKKMQEFRELQQNYLSLKEYVTKYRHLEVYCPHLYTRDETRANKFVHGLHDGLRSKVMSRRPHDLDEAVTMARHKEEDWARTRKNHHKKTGQHSQAGQILMRGVMTEHSGRNMPNRSGTTEKAVTTLTPLRCPICSCVHLGKPCYRETRACLYYGRMGHFIKDCPTM